MQLELQESVAFELHNVMIAKKDGTAIMKSDLFSRVLFAFFLLLCRPPLPPPFLGTFSSRPLLPHSNCVSVL